MPSVTGSIRFEDFTLFIIAAMVELRQMPPEGHPLTRILEQMPPSLGIITDMSIEGAERVVELVSDDMEIFLEHFASTMPPAQPIVGISVWQGSLEVNADGEITFDGVYRRPTPSDYAVLADLQQKLDDEAMANALAHAKMCHACAEKMGLDPSLVQEAAESYDDTRHIFVRMPVIPGEA